MTRAPTGGLGESSGEATTRPGRVKTLLLAGGCAAFAVLFTGLGMWQVQRLFWKLDLIERVEARIHAKPKPLPALVNSDDEYRRVALSGHFLNDRETLVQAVTELGGGFWVLTPFVTDGGLTVLVNRGFVPPENRAPESRATAIVDGPTRVVGLLRLTEPGGGFLRSNDPLSDRWYSRDVGAIANARGLDGRTASYFVDAEPQPNPDALPIGGLTVVRFSNHHLGYAFTWFVLAAMSAGAATSILRQHGRAFSLPQ